MLRKIVVNKLIILMLTVGCIIFALYFNCIYDKDKVYNYKNITVYADSVNLRNVQSIMLKCDSILKSHNIYIHHTTLILCNTEQEYNRKTLFLKRGTLGINIVPFHFIIMAPADYSNDLQYKKDERLIDRSLSSSITHELIHEYEYSHIGPLNFFYLKFSRSWKLEGYAEYVAGHSSLNVADGYDIYNNIKSEDEVIGDNQLLKVTYWYYLWRLRTSYLLDVKKITLNEFWNATLNDEILDNEIKEYIKKSRYNICQ